MSSTPQGSFRILPRLGIILAGLAIGCTREQSSQADGFVVLGPRSAREFRFNEGDTLIEIQALPQEVRLAADRTARGLYDPACTRYFIHDMTYVTFFKYRCDGTVVDDGEGLASFDAKGNQIGGLLHFLTFEDLASLHPRERARTH